MPTMMRIVALSMPSEVNIRIIIWMIAVEPKFESSERLYLIAILGC